MTSAIDLSDPLIYNLIQRSDKPTIQSVKSVKSIDTNMNNDTNPISINKINNNIKINNKKCHILQPFKQLLIFIAIVFIIYFIIYKYIININKNKNNIY